MGTLAVRVTGAGKTYGPRRLFHDLDLEVTDGEFLVVVGPSGGGKSTLLRALAGLEQLDAGTVEWGDDAGGRPPTGVVFQQPLLMPWLTVRDNVRLGGGYRANRARFEADRADRLLARFGLADLADSYPDQLSGGQAQRVAIARAAAIRPRLLLLDEPFSALDPGTRGDLQRWLRSTTEELELTTVLVTHDVDEALLVGDRIALLDGSGAIGRVWENSADNGALRRELLAHYGTSPKAGVS
ncbi:sulfate transport system ATP-binding protein/sulfonate transport system ATP-binding protein [Saccharopolyspora antimicrobica]|uniref:Sulfate transport system ATP-binding protein/sulfonate transport system ATP-binding protein n=1 Tax=Saccharopolyspora antimicrobica TaxID=455193 RepID=A0A1I5GY71_9PSEU|nr:ABC transporter ATP-binding protein [Saccharopolyspora antimicrobica]RKT89258.1 sulfate transport system ATP-binding protein/sulfonate transport system ATP-binding protein [Saccharopolyspora antimicrobica]SFO40903.1 sulfate transport system ATP-binding protein/sulfonate transport system ATP-binding protein [Saccharopolyspora antimicrobica]